MPEISHLEPKNRQVMFKDGRKLWRVDHIIFCTGYKFCQPFIKAGPRARMPMFPDGLTLDNLYDHIVYKDNPSLAFIGMVQGGAPTFLVAQAQAAFLSRLWAGRLSMAKAAEIRTVTSDKDNARHLVPYPQFMDYLLRLEKVCEAADQSLEDEEVEGNLPFKWTLEMDWIRQNRREIREAFMAHSKTDQKKITRLDQLGFSVNLSPTSPNIKMVTPFLILHAAHFPEGHLDLLDAYFPRRHTKDAAFRGVEIFEQVKKIFAPTQHALQPGSRTLFREGTQRLLNFGLGRLERALADIQDQEEDTQPQNGARGRESKTSAVEDSQGTSHVSPSPQQQQKQMRDIYAELFSNA